MNETQLKTTKSKHESRKAQLQARQRRKNKKRRDIEEQRDIKKAMELIYL